MNYLTYKNTRISQICFGCEPLGGTDCGVFDLDQLSQAIHKAIEMGLNFFDTSGVYGLGQSELNLSKILGKKRKDVFIASKGGLSWQPVLPGERATIIKDSSPIALERNLDDSLKRLNLEIIPLYYIHWPDMLVDFSDTFTFLKRMQQKGKIGMIGCSNFNLEQLKMAQSVVDIDFLQLSYHLLDSDIPSDLISFCKDNRINIIAYNVLCYGLLTGKFKQLPHFEVNDRRHRLPIFEPNQFKKAQEKINQLETEAKQKSLSLLDYVLSLYKQSAELDAFILGMKTPSQVLKNLA